MKTIVHIVTLTIAALVFSINANAETVVNTKTKATKVGYSNATEQRLAAIKIKSLGITKEEYARAETHRSLISEMDKNNTLSTLEILGIYAKTTAEKRKYARKFAKSIHQYTKKVLDFQKIVRQANKDLYGDVSMFDYTPMPKTIKKAIRRVSQTININTCNELCEQEVKALMTTAIVFPVDLYFTNATNLEIQHWALKLNINRNDVDQGYITLNHTY